MSSKSEQKPFLTVRNGFLTYKNDAWFQGEDAVLCYGDVYCHQASPPPRDPFFDWSSEVTRYGEEVIPRYFINSNNYHDFINNELLPTLRFSITTRLERAAAELGCDPDGFGPIGGSWCAVKGKHFPVELRVNVRPCREK